MELVVALVVLVLIGVPVAITAWSMWMQRPSGRR